MQRTTGPAARVVDIVGAWAAREPDRVCMTFHDARARPEPVTYGRFHREARSFAALYRSRGLNPGDPVVLLADSVPTFVSAFLGAQQAGLLAVPVPRPEPLERAARTQDRIVEIAKGSGARGLFSPRPEWLRGEVGEALSASGLIALSPEDLPGPDAADRSGAVPDVAIPFAYCQFTSGSGGRAKGVLLTHDNVLANIRSRSEAYGLDESDVAVTWLPFYHDMGLIGYVLHPLVTGRPCHVISPAQFVGDPVSWLALITRVGATISTAPNLGYALCVRRVSDEQMAGLDLSRWRRAFSGAEPVTRDVVESFVRRFAPVGFRASALLAAYGLAENTLTATSRRPGEGTRFDEVSLEGLGSGRARLAEGDEPRRAVACVGRSLPGQEIAILGGDGGALAERAVGEIAIRSDSVMHGYLAGTSGAAAVRPDGWLLTGDLGYVAGGELFVLGRQKDVIIRGGTNYYPEDLEDAVAALEGRPIRRAAAFSVPGRERERVVLVAEPRKDWTGSPAELAAAIRQAIFAKVRLAPDDIVLAPAGTLPMTTSGKLIRPEASRLYQEGRWASP